MLCQVKLDDSDDPYAIVVNTYSWPQNRKQLSRIIARTASTVTIYPPLAFDLPARLNPKLNVQRWQTESIGVEDLKIDATHSSFQGGQLSFNHVYGGWASKVEVRFAANYNCMVDGSLQCEVRHCFLADRIGEGSRGTALYLHASTSFCLIEDNILLREMPCLFLAGAATGNVIAYNYIGESLVFGQRGKGIINNHGPHDSYNLYEGNICQNFQSDGYFGSASDETLFRNWFHGQAPGFEPSWTISLNRFTRRHSLVGNIIGTDGTDNGDVSYGNPNMGNGVWTGTAQPSLGDWWADFAAMRAALPG